MTIFAIEPDVAAANRQQTIVPAPRAFPGIVSIDESHVVLRRVL
jgi:hypothetical protein